MPATPWSRALGIALLVVLAGCVLPGGGSTGEPTATDVPDGNTLAATETQTPAATQAPTTTRPELPPGVTATKVENASALLAAHHATLHRAGYRVTEFTGPSQRTYVAAANGSAYRIIPGPMTTAPAVWANETVTLAKHTEDNETVYQRPPRQWAPPTQRTGTDVLRDVFTDSTYIVNGTAACGDGRCTVLTATDSARFQHLDARALVAPSGVLYQYHATYTRSQDNQTVPGEYHLVLDEFSNVTVDRPAWVDPGLNATR